MKFLVGFWALLATFLSFAAIAAEYPEPQQEDWIAKDFKFHTGEVMPELRLHYTTIGDPTGMPVIVHMEAAVQLKACSRQLSLANCLAPANRSMQLSIT